MGIPIPINHKLVEFAIGFVVVMLLARCSGIGPPKGRHRR